MRHPWRAAYVIAAVFAAIRLVSDAMIPPHMQWWLTPAVAGTASLLTSACWIAAFRAQRKEVTSDAS